MDQVTDPYAELLEAQALLLLLLERSEQLIHNLHLEGFNG
jgi:hypothetical protein